MTKALQDGEWQRTKDAFYVRAFKFYYGTIFKDEPHPTVRFAKALIESSQVVPDEGIKRWAKEYRNKDNDLPPSS